MLPTIPICCETQFADSSLESTIAKSAARARDGSEALNKAAELNPDVVLLDLSIPILHGLKVAQTLARDFPAIAVVIMSEQDELLLKQIAEKAASNTLLPNPFSQAAWGRC